MPIQFVCPSCRKMHRAPPEYAGRQARCSCGAVLTVPAPAAQPVASVPPRPAQNPTAAIPRAAPLEATPVAPPPPRAAPRAAVPPAAAPAAIDPDAWSFESQSHDKHVSLAVKPSPLAKFFRQQGLLVIAVAGGLAGLFVLGFAAWALFAGSANATRYFPDDCLVVGSANVDELMSSAVFQDMKKDMPGVESGQRDMEDELGLSPANISRMTFAMGGKLTSPNDADFVIVVYLKNAVSAPTSRPMSRPRVSRRTSGTRRSRSVALARTKRPTSSVSATARGSVARRSACPIAS